MPIRVFAKIILREHIKYVGKHRLCYLIIHLLLILVKITLLLSFNFFLSRTCQCCRNISPNSTRLLS
nr:MAG TPA: hypothetical protein [Bacteriophage sp.]